MAETRWQMLAGHNGDVACLRTNGILPHRDRDWLELDVHEVLSDGWTAITLFRKYKIYCARLSIILD
jgi:hypothetical protein